MTHVMRAVCRFFRSLICKCQQRPTVPKEPTSSQRIVPDRRCPLGGEVSMTVRTDHQSDYDPAQLVLYGAAAVVLLVYAWTFAL